MIRSVRFRALCFAALVPVVAVVVALVQPMAVTAEETSPHAVANPAPTPSGHPSSSQQTTARVMEKNGDSDRDLALATQPIHAFPVMLLAAMLMTCAAVSITARERSARN